MKLLRVFAVLGAALLVGRHLTTRLRGQFLGMSHPGGFLTASSVRNGRFSRGAASRSYAWDASGAVDASWVDEDAITAHAQRAFEASPSPARDAANRAE